MHRKLLLLSAVVFALVNCGVGTRCFAEAADVSAQFEQADEYGDKGNYEQAEAIYKDVAEEYVGTESGLRAQRKLVCLYIKRGRTAEAEAAYQELLEGYGDDKGIAEAVDDVADAYRDVKEYEKALEIHSYVADTWGDSAKAIDAQAGIARVNIALGKEEAAEAAIEKLVADFSESEDIANTVDEVADEWRDAKKYDKALGLYKYVVETWPDSDQAMGSQADVAKSYIELGDDPNAKAAVDKLIADFAGRDEMADVVDDVADEWQDVKKYDKALGLYKYVVETWPESEQAMGSQAEVAKSYIALGDDPNAKAAIDELIAKFAGRDEIADAVDDVADEYRDAKKYEEAVELYKYVVNTWPESEQAMGSQGCVVRIYVAFGDEPNATAATDKLLADFGANSDLRKVLSEIAAEYEQWGEYLRARGVYRQIVSDSEKADGNEPGLDTAKTQILCYISDGNDGAAFEAISQLIIDYNKHPDLAKSVLEIGKKYEDMGQLAFDVASSRPGRPNEPGIARGKEYFKKALAVGEKIITELSELDKDATVEAYNLAAECCYRMDSWEKAIGYYQEIVDRAPDYHYAWNAQYMVGHCYKTLRNRGLIDRAEGKVLIRKAYEKVLENYPDSPAARRSPMAQYSYAKG